MANLTTERLALRPFRPADAAEFARLAGEWAVACMTSDIPHPLSAEQAVLWLKPARGEVRYAIEHHGDLVGGVGFYRRPSGAAELGFWLGTRFWGRGFATEASRAVVRLGFEKHAVPLFTSAHFSDNAASRNVLAKLGFVPTGDCRIECVSRGGEIEATTYELDRQRASRFIPGLARAPAPRERLLGFVAWMRRGLDRGKPPSSSGQPTSGLS